MAEHAIEIEGLSKAYSRGFLGKSRVEALKGVSLKAARGEVVGLLGPNGAGKTTLVKALVGLIRPDAGRLAIFGGDVAESASRRRLGYLPERFTPEPDLTGIEALERDGALYGLPRRERRERAATLAERVGLARDVATRRTATYSKGQLARLGIAMSLMPDPLLVLLDEPTDGLDPVGRAQVRDLVLAFKAESRTVLLNSHLLSEAERCCDRVAILNRGQLVAEGSLDALLAAGTAHGHFLVRTAPAPDDGLVAAVAAAAKAAKREGPDGIAVELAAEADVDRVVDLVRAKGFSLRELVPRRATLEDVFMNLIVPPAAEPDRGRAA